MSGSRRGAAQVVSGLGALITLLALVGGLPVLLYWLGGSPLPGHLPGWHGAVTALSRPDSTMVFLAAVRDIAWLGWAAFTVAVIAETQALARGRAAPRLRLGQLQNLAGRLVAVAALTVSGASAGVALAVPTPAQAAATAVLPAHPARQQAPLARLAAVEQTGSYRLVTVTPGDCLWSIAEHYLGAGDRYPEIAALNLGREMSGGQVFQDPSLIQPGWVLRVPNWPGAPTRPVARDGHDRSGRHEHPTSHSWFSGSHLGATRPARSPSPGNGRTIDTADVSATHGSSDVGGQIAAFGLGVLAGSAVLRLAQLRHRQRQARRPGRRIPLPATSAVVDAERRIRATARASPLSPLRAALAELAAGLLDQGGPLPGIVGMRVLSDGLELVLSGPATEPPPPPLTVPGGRQGRTWRLDFAGLRNNPPNSVGDLLPGLVTIGVVPDGYLLIDLEYLGITSVRGPREMTEAVLRAAAVELATGQLAGWYDLVLVGFGELDMLDGRVTSCDSISEGLDMLAVKATRMNRLLAAEPWTDVRRRRMAEPCDEDWALSLLVSRLPPTLAELHLLGGMVSESGGIGALLADELTPLGAEADRGALAGVQFERIELTADPAAPGGMVAHVPGLGLRAWPVPLDDAQYEALTGLFATAAADGDVAPDEAPYSEWSWPSGLAAEDDDAREPDAALATVLGPTREAGFGERTDVGAETDDDTGGEALARAAGGVLPADDAQASGLRIGVLGTFTVNGNPGTLLPVQSQLILALALHVPTGLANQQLCYLLGADPDHPRPGDSLRQLIVRTRRKLGRPGDGREWIEHLGGGQYALHPLAWLDWHEFDDLSSRGIATGDRQLLRQALRLVRGEPFAGCDYWWLDLALTENVRAQIVDTAERLADLELVAGDAAASARAARAGLASEPAAEQLWRVLMRAEHAAGNLNGVREAWRRCLDTIGEIAPDGEPHPRTAALYRELTKGAGARAVWT